MFTCSWKITVSIQKKYIFTLQGKHDHQSTSHKNCENIGAVGFKPSTLCANTYSRSKETTALAKTSSSGRCLGTHPYLTNREIQIKSKMEDPFQIQSSQHIISLLTVMCTEVYIQYTEKSFFDSMVLLKHTTLSQTLSSNISWETQEK